MGARALTLNDDLAVLKSISHDTNVSALVTLRKLVQNWKLEMKVYDQTTPAKSSSYMNSSSTELVTRTPLRVTEKIEPPSTYKPIYKQSISLDTVETVKKLRPVTFGRDDACFSPSVSKLSQSASPTNPSSKRLLLQTPTAMFSPSCIDQTTQTDIIVDNQARTVLPSTGVDSGTLYSAARNIDWEKVVPPQVQELEQKLKDARERIQYQVVLLAQYQSSLQQRNNVIHKMQEQLSRHCSSLFSTPSPVSHTSTQTVSEAVNLCNCADKQKDMVHMTQNIVELKCELAEHIAANEKLRIENESLQMEKTKHIEMISKQQSDLLDLRTNLKENQVTLEQSKQENAYFELRWTLSVKELTRLESEVTQIPNLVKEIDKLKHENTELLQKIQCRNELIQRSNHQAAHDVKQLSDVQMKLTDALDTIECLNAELIEKESTLNQLTEQISTNSKELEQQKFLVAEFTSTIADLMTVVTARTDSKRCV